MHHCKYWGIALYANCYIAFNVFRFNGVAIYVGYYSG